MHPKDADGMANSVDPDQTASSEAVWSWSALFAETYLFQYIEFVRYYRKLFWQTISIIVDGVSAELLWYCTSRMKIWNDLTKCTFLESITRLNDSLIIRRYYAGKGIHGDRHGTHVIDIDSFSIWYCMNTCIFRRQRLIVFIYLINFKNNISLNAVPDLILMNISKKWKSWKCSSSPFEIALYYKREQFDMNYRTLPKDLKSALSKNKKTKKKKKKKTA